MITIPEKELKIKYVRSSGPGGQNVNRRATKAQLRWNIDESQILNDEQKERLHSKFRKNEIIIESDQTRYQLQNKKIVIQRLNNLVNQALKREKKRILVEPDKVAKKKKRIRRKEKEKRKQKKELRKPIKDW